MKMRYWSNTTATGKLKRPLTCHLRVQNRVPRNVALLLCTVGECNLNAVGKTAARCRTYADGRVNGSKSVDRGNFFDLDLSSYL